MKIKRPMYRDILALKKALDAGKHDRKNVFGYEDEGVLRVAEYLPANQSDLELFWSTDPYQVIFTLLGIQRD